MTAARARRQAPRIAPAQTLELLVRAEPAALAPADPPAAPPVGPEAPGRDFSAAREMIWIDADTYVEREYRAGYHDYSLWEEGRDGIGYTHETIRKSVRWGRVDTSYPYECQRLTVEQVGDAISADVQRLRELEDRIIAACPELEAVADRGPLYRSRGRVRLGGDPRSRYQIVMSKRGPPP